MPTGFKIWAVPRKESDFKDLARLPLLVWPFFSLLVGCAGEVAPPPPKPGLPSGGDAGATASQPQPEANQEVPQTRTVLPENNIVTETESALKSASLSLNFESLSNGFDSSLVEQVAKPEKDIHVFMNCDGRAWAHHDATEKTVAFPDLRSSFADPKPECVYQVAPGRAWALSQSSESKVLHFGLAPGAVLSPMAVQSATGSASDEETNATAAAAGSSAFKLISTRIRSEEASSLSLLGVSYAGVAFQNGKFIQFYELPALLQDQAKPSLTDLKIELTQIPWDSKKRGSAVAAGRVGAEYWVASKTNLYWLRQKKSSKNSKAGYVWQEQDLSFEPFSREELASMHVRGVGIAVSSKNDVLKVEGRVSLLADEQLSITPDQQWQEQIRPLAEKACVSCHFPASERVWRDALEASAWTGAWRALLADQIVHNMMPPPGSEEAALLSEGERNKLGAWLLSLAGSDPRSLLQSLFISQSDSSSSGMSYSRDPSPGSAPTGNSAGSP